MMAALCVISSAPMIENIWSRVMSVLVEITHTSVLFPPLTRAQHKPLFQPTAHSAASVFARLSPLCGSVIGGKNNQCGALIGGRELAAVPLYNLAHCVLTVTSCNETVKRVIAHAPTHCANFMKST